MKHTAVLGEVAEVFNGKTPAKSDQRNAGYPVLKIKDVDALGAFKGKFESFVDDEFAAKFKAKHLCAGDTLILNAAHNADYVASKMFFAAHDYQKPLITGEWTVVRPNQTVADPGYVRHYIQSASATKQLKEMVNGIHLYPRDVANCSIPFPALSDQRRIAAILDKADSLRAKRREAIAKLDKLLEAVFLDMFGDPVTNPKSWKEAQLGEVCDIGSSNRVFAEELVDTGVPFYRGTEIGQLGEGKPVIPDLFITWEHYEKLKSQSGVPEKGDLLLPSICHDGRIHVVTDDSPFYFKDGRVLWIKSGRSQLNSAYLRFHLKQLFLANYSKIASGTTFAELKIFALKAIKILTPPLEEQGRFGEIVDSICNVRARKLAHLDHLNSLFTSIQQRAFFSHAA